MKKLFGLALAAGLLTLQVANAQNQQESITAENSQQIAMAKVNAPVKGEGDKKSKAQSSTVYNAGANKPTSTFAPSGNGSSGGFTVRKFEESKVAKKLRRGEARSRFSVPNPKGKPLVHKRKGKFQLFG